jgi:hypothetical protein
LIVLTLTVDVVDALYEELMNQRLQGFAQDSMAEGVITGYSFRSESAPAPESAEG